MVINNFSSILTGFSIVSALILLFAYLFFLHQMRKTLIGKIACCFVLLGLAGLQICHQMFYIDNLEVLSSRFYCTLLLILPVAFFFFGRETLFPDGQHHWWDTLHFLPVAIGAFFPLNIIPVLAFSLGTGYTFWFITAIFKLRSQHSRFKFELFFFGLFALMAFSALLLGLLLPIIDHSIFYFAYGNSISMALVLIVAALLIFPELLNDIVSITELAYAKSKLIGIDTEQKLAQLETLMVQDKQFENEQLSLNTLADLMDMSSHQLSELINTEYGYSFPRFVREHRVRAAKSLLVSEFNTSVLAISMMTGFKSQSSFYTAFKEITGESPGNYRRKRAQSC